MAFAVIDPSLPTILGIFAGMLVGFYGLARLMLGQATKDREADRREREALTKAISKMADSSQEVAEATKKGAKEAKQRNGHLGEQNIKIVELITGQNQDVIDIKESNSKIASILSKSAVIAAEDRVVLTGSPQIVHEQHVEHQTVENKA